MKLVLFSAQNYSEAAVKTQLINLIGKNQPTIGYISSCPDPSREFYQKTKQYYAHIGATITPYVDLESGFEPSYINLVFQADAIHLSGGNTYQFFYWIIQRGLRKRLFDYAQSDKVIIGVSAGAIIMTPNISYSELCGDRNNIGLKDLKGLALVDFCFVPHAVEGNRLAQNIVLKSSLDKSKVVVASDSDYLIVNGSQIQIYGQPKLAIDGKIVDLEYLRR